ncbi:MAG: GAF and ANTAR domain-containing protein [Actinophytocola sp.]|uniref:GAF and ANTAR domain-containing protein n=1 Tax=Actinophytocola sp. TaxID=1872138 RepID=UPI003D6C32B9
MNRQQEKRAGVVTAPSAESLAQEFVRLTRELLDSGSVAAVLDRVVFAARDIVPGADLVSVTLRSPDGEFHTPVETSQVASDLDQLQYRFGEGACVEAARPSGPAIAISDDLATDPRWPRFGPAAAAFGFRSLVSTALLPDAKSPQLSGALNVYSRAPHGLASADRDILLLLATHASLALATTSAVSRGDLKAEQLHQALDSRDAIGQAKGVLMARRGITAEQAFALLRRTSQELNIKLRELARVVTERNAELDHADQCEDVKK